MMTYESIANCRSDTYMELLQANRPYSLMDIVNLNFDNDASN